jgi:hypothetical protein
MRSNQRKARIVSILEINKLDLFTKPRR